MRRKSLLYEGRAAGESMIAAFDVHYFRNGGARAAAVLFNSYEDVRAKVHYTKLFSQTNAYVPGEFYRRELPCILDLIAILEDPPQVAIIDGYVMLGNRPGLGRHLFQALEKKVKVIGVAKSRFQGAICHELLRGKSRTPLYITADGMDQVQAAEKIRSMHGDHRIPTLLKAVDHLARGLGGTSEK